MYNLLAAEPPGERLRISIKLLYLAYFTRSCRTVWPACSPISAGAGAATVMPTVVALKVAKLNIP